MESKVLSSLALWWNVVMEGMWSAKVDPFCMCCYRTVASGTEESQLAEFERNHICEDRLHTVLSVPSGSSEVGLN
jgi:hypothetical protein